MNKSVIMKEDVIMKDEVEGIILVLSCQKHLDTRLKEFSLPKTEYCSWKVIYVIGDFLMEKTYELRGEHNNILYLKCEDSYLHLLKKLVLSFKVLNELFIIKQGVLRCGDDLIFNEKKLIDFLNKDNKFDFWGQGYFNRDLQIKDKSTLKKTKNNTFMLKYYTKHREDKNNPHHNLKGIDLTKYTKQPDLFGPSGVIYYISIKCCQIAIHHLENIQFNILHLDEFTNSYPYLIEDVGMAFIMYMNDIKFKHNDIFFDKPNSICNHTNKYKY